VKFRTIFFVFNAVILLAFGFTFLSPALVLGWSDAAPFLARNWPLALGFLAVIGGLDAFFAANWRLLSLLEREDWPAISSLLRNRIMVKGAITLPRVRLYLNTLLILADLEGVKELEAAVAAKRPRILERESLLFGVARLLRGDAAGAEKLLSGGGERRGSEWRDFYLAFSRAKAGKDDDARSGLVALAIEPHRAGLAVRGLSAFLARDLCPAAAPSDAEAAALAKAEDARARIARTHSRARWTMAAAAARRDIPGVVMSRYLDRAEEWIYGERNAQDR